jgi:ATP-binding cassette subfamily B protein
MSKKTSSNIKISQILKHFWLGVKPTKWLFFISYTLYFINCLISVFIPVYYKNFFDLLGKATNPQSSIDGLIKIILVIACLHFLMWLFWRSADFISSTMMSKTMAKLKQNAFNYTLKHSFSFFSNSFTGGLVQKVNRFTRAFEVLSNSVVYQIFPLLVTVVGSIIVTWFLAPIVSVLIIVWVVVFTTFNLGFSMWKLKYDTAVAEADSKTTGYLSDSITNNNAVSLFTAFNYESNSFKDVSDDQAKKTKFSWHLADTVDAVQSLLIFIVEFFIFYYALKYWERGLVTIGVFVLAQSYIIAVANQLWGLNKTIRGIYQGFADAKEMVEILVTPYEIKDIPNAKDLRVMNGEIAFKDVTFNFNETREVLSNINVTIKPGEKLALIGPSGAGKTTFVRLIMRLYDLTQGRIEIDGQDIHTVKQDSLRENISLVPQDPVLFHRTLLENIRYGRRDATDDEVKEAARLAHCDEFIDNLPLKYDTFVGERGIKLSGGERQRVAIARAILKHAPILILDEATSSLDSHSEMLIQSALDNLMKGCTTIVIAHRLSTIRKMDRIIAMKDGQIVEQGTHSELANKDSGLYKKLWDLQAGGFVGGE